MTARRRPTLGGVGGVGGGGVDGGVVVVVVEPDVSRTTTLNAYSVAEATFPTADSIKAAACAPDGTFPPYDSL